MIISNYFSNKTFLILGMGKTGTALSNALYKSHANVSFWDDDPQIRKKFTKSNFKKFSNTKKQWEAIDYIIPSPGISISGDSQHKIIYLSRKYKKKVISELDLFQDVISKENKINKNNIKIIAVTGTNGKSTIVSLIHHLLKSNSVPSSLIGNIGNSIFNSKFINNGFYVIEVSSYQLETSKIFSPNVAIISNLSSDHLSRHKSMKNYFNQKSKILNNLVRDDTAILNCNHMLVKSKALDLFKNKKSNVISFDFVKKESRFYSSKKNTLIKEKLRKIKYDNPFLYGEHNEENVQIALKALSSLGFKKQLLKKSLYNFIGLAHRQELILNNKNLKVINDSKATNIDSMIKAIKNYKNIYLICGGILKDKNLNSLTPYTHKIKKVYITGVKKNQFINFFSKKNKIFVSSNLNKIVKECFKDVNAREESTILFCPGAASFDQFKNFEERGNKFKKIVLGNSKK